MGGREAQHLQFSGKTLKRVVVHPRSTRAGWGSKDGGGGKQKGITDGEDLMVAEGLVETTATIYWGVMGKTQTLSREMTFLFHRLSPLLAFFYHFPQPGISSEGY